MNRLLRALMLLVVLASLIVAALSFALLREIRRPVDPEAAEPVEFTIEPGQTAAQVAESLKDVNLIRQPLLFRLMLRERDAADNLKVGSYQLSPSMTMGEIISALQVAPSFAENEFQTIEGMRMEEVAERIVAAGLAPSTDAFLQLARDPEPFKENHQRLQSIPQGQSLEGYLFPNTYRIKATASISEVIETMLTEGFDANYEKFEREVLVPNNIHEIVTMASIVQREAANEKEMPHLAYIFWNRLKSENLAETGGLLAADPTVQYFLGYSEEQKKWWRDGLTQADLDTDNPYNTRKRPGLPPGPIANPGLAALRAAARPGAERPDGSDGKADLYFVKRCGENAHNFATKLDEFNILVQELNNCKQ